VGNFVTASQAQRKRYTKMITKVSSGDYKLEAVSFNLKPVCVARFHSFFFFLLQSSANTIVQNLMTGQLEEEKMQVCVRLGIRLLYKGRGAEWKAHAVCSTNSLIHGSAHTSFPSWTSPEISFD